MKNNKGIIVIIIIISVLVLALIGGIVFVAISKNKKGNKGVVVTPPTNNEENNQQQIEEFNEQFAGYEGDDISGTLLKSLLSAVILSNNSNEEHQVTVKILDTDLEDGTTDATDLTKAQQEIKTTEIYEVKYDKEDGYISEITIEKTENITVSPEAKRFNQKFTSYADEIIDGETIKGELAKLISESNKENPEHKISLHAGSIKSIKEIVDDDNYKIKLSYDDDGYVKRIDAEKQDESSDDDEENNDFESNIASAVVRTFNANFTTYEGDNRSASQVRAFISAVNASNNNDEEHQIEIEPEDIASEIKSSKKYNIELKKGKDGYINKAIITEAEFSE